MEQVKYNLEYYGTGVYFIFINMLPIKDVDFKVCNSFDVILYFFNMCDSLSIFKHFIFLRESIVFIVGRLISFWL